MSDRVLVSVADGIGHIRLNRPEAANAFDLETTRSFGEAVDRVAEEDVLVVLLTGAGARFCAGGDVTSFVAQEDAPAYLLELATLLDSHVQRLGALPKPVTAAVQGAVAGAGLALVLTADLVVSAPSTKYTMAYANIGLTPDCGVSYLLPRIVGPRLAIQLTLERRVLDAPQALEWGLITSIADDAQADAAELAVLLAREHGVSQALGQARRLLRGAYDDPRETHAADEARTIAAAVATEPAQALLRAFTSRR